MRGILGLAGILVALAVVGVVVKKQLATVPGALPTQQASGALPAGAPSAAVQQQYRQALEGAMQSPRQMPEEP